MNNENKIQESINKEQVNLGRFQSEEKQNQNSIEKQCIKITELSQEMQIDCEPQVLSTLLRNFILYKNDVCLYSARFNRIQSYGSNR